MIILRLALSVALIATRVHAQDLTLRPPVAGPDEAALTASLYASLARGDLEGAAERLRQFRSEFPANRRTFLLGLDVDLARGPAAAALDGYERWVVGRPEEPMALRRIATAILGEVAGGQESGPTRLTALLALADDGDPDASARLRASVAAGSLGDASILAAAGDPAGAARVTEALATPVPNKIALVRALAQGHHRSAIPALVAMLNDPRPEHQAAAADALADLGARDQVRRLQALLKTPNAPQFLTVAVAGALFRLDDFTAVNQLQDWLHSDVPAMRLSAARALASRPNPAWTETIRALTADSDPMVRLEAATLLATVDPEGARSALQDLGSYPEEAIRAKAVETAVVVLPHHLHELRGLLRSELGIRIAAARRILESTR